MNRAFALVFLALTSIPFAVHAQVSLQRPLHIPAMVLSDAVADPGGAEGGMGGAGGGQAEYSATRGGAFSLGGIDLAISTLGIGAEFATNVTPRVDLRVFGNYTNLRHQFSQSGFRIALNIGMANAGAKLDYYPPLSRFFPLRISPGFLLANSNHVAASLHGQHGATFTLNNVDYFSSDANPVFGSGRLSLGGRGLMLTAGFGHYVSRTRKGFSFPFEAGVAFISTPVAQFNLSGDVCSVDDPTFCRPAAQFPDFYVNLAAQVVTWNHRVAPFAIYPILQGGVSYSFSFRRRGIYQMRREYGKTTNYEW